MEAEVVEAENVTAASTGRVDALLGERKWGKVPRGLGRLLGKRNMTQVASRSSAETMM